MKKSEDWIKDRLAKFINEENGRFPFDEQDIESIFPEWMEEYIRELENER